jgi:hypothetical protein
MKCIMLAQNKALYRRHHDIEQASLFCQSPTYIKTLKTFFNLE